ncbi:hypothetical protein WUBG_16249 [Wuchereria bancrofti]|uniref:Uncharacterized protein n=1 Tax=Wuchereria bancrofti TaxID=6293 RepID=J9AFL4_WUCBA|nr:hypothetical protein WUBG_16249 [Wuchereria bancrofti]
MFKEPACVIALKFISGKHSLLLRCEEEETEEQRYVRLASQSLQYLHWFCTQSLSEEQRNRIIDFFNNRSYRRLLTSSSQIVSATMILANRVASLLNGWEVILNSALPTTALAHLDSVDRNVGRASALLILEMTKANVLFAVLDIDNAVVNRVISLIKRKKKCEEEETEEQRYVRLASQSLQYLHWFCTQSLSEEQRNRIIDFFNNRSYRRLLTSSSQVISYLK